jgi:uncharacterized protein YjbI with pentapeptide repeats
MQTCIFGEAQAANSNWKSASLEQCVLTGATLDGSDFTKAKLKTVDMHDVSQKNTLWEKASLVDVAGTDPDRLAAENWVPKS